MITFFLALCYYIFIWPFVMIFKLLIWPFKIMMYIVLLPFRLLEWLFSIPGRILFPSRHTHTYNDDTMDDFFDWVEEYECLTDDD